MGRPLRARSPYPGHSAAHPLSQQGSALSLKIRRKHMFLVMGITGKVGGATAEHLLAHGMEVRALVRNREKTSSWANQGVDLVDGDWNDSAAIERALKGVECPSSSAVARHFGTNCERRSSPVLRLRRRPAFARARFLNPLSEPRCDRRPRRAEPMPVDGPADRFHLRPAY